MPIVLDPPESTPLPPAPEDLRFAWELLYLSLGFHQDHDEPNNFALRKFSEGWMAPLERLYQLVRERDDLAGWGVLFDVDECHADDLPYLAQYPGCILTPEMSVEQRRDEIRQPTGWKRGLTETIRIATRRTLEPVVEGEELFVIIRPRTPEPGRHFIRTLTAQTPDPDWTARVLEENVPAWEVIDYAAITGESFAELTGSKYTTFGAIAAALADFKDLTEALPGEL